MRRLVAVGLALLLMVCVALGALAWRLSQGPIEVPELAARIEDTLNRPGSRARIAIGAAELSWDGWRQGLSPFELRLRHVRVLDEAGRAELDLPEASVSLAYRWLLLGRIAPRRVELFGVVLRARRDATGHFDFALGSLGGGEDAPEAEAEAAPSIDELLSQLAGGQGQDTPLSALEEVQVRDARILVTDAQLGAEWALDHAGLILRRVAHQGLELDGRATLRLGPAEVPTRLHATLSGTPARFEARLTLLQVRPALLARQAPILAPLGAVDATASMEVRVGARADGGEASLGAVLNLGPGRLALGGGEVAIAGADIALAATPNSLRLDRAVLRLQPSAAGAALRHEGPILSLAGEAARGEEAWTGTLRGHVDRVAMGGLAEHWPPDIAEDAREWLVENITAGTARNGDITLRASVPVALDDLRVTDLAGTIEAEDLTVHWLRPMPPAEGVGGTAQFRLNDISVDVRTGRQQGAAIQVRGGTLRFYDFDRRPSMADLDLRLAGAVPDIVTLLRHPRLELGERLRTIPELAGTAQEVRLHLAFPLIKQLTFDDLRMQTEARVTDLRATRVVLGRDLDRGTADLHVDMEGLRLQGQAMLTDIPVRVGVEMDFRRGPAGQVLSRETLSGRADFRQIAALGFDLRDHAEGTVQIEARNESRRGQPSRVTLRGDLREARLMVDPLGWQKPRGVAGSAEVALRMQGDQVTALEQLRIEAPDGLLRARGNAFRNGWPERLELQEVVLGATRLSGEVRPPRNPGNDWQVTLRGASLDLTRALADRPEDDRAGQRPDPPRSGASFALDWRFDRMVLGPQRSTGAVTGRARLDGAGVLQQADAEARFGNAGATFRLTPEGTRRRVAITSDDGGGLLRLLDLVQSIQGGRLTVDAQYEHGRPGAPVAGQAELTEFSVRNAPAFAKLLQAMTLYGLVDAVSGQGLNFMRLVAPFRMTPDVLELEDARAFSASLGLTARGRIDRRRALLDMDGTIVPAYFFNQILGNIPILGRLFSPEAGGGLFAATYRLRGPLADPNVTVNPLAALTPGFLRGIFQLGSDGQPRSMSPEVQRQGRQSRSRPMPQSPTVPDGPLRGPPPN